MSGNRGKMVLDFKIEGGVVTFDVQNGNGEGCEALAEIFTLDGDGDAEVNYKPEHKRRVTAKKATA